MNDAAASLVHPQPSKDQVYRRQRLAARRLHHIAEEQQQGLRASPEDLVFINQALVEDPPGITCGGPPPHEFHGWYVDLFYGGEPFAFKPTVADVHTQPTDEGGNLVGRVLHVGTAAPRLIVVNVDGARSFVGFVSDNSELVTQNFQRLTDREWADRVSHANPDDVPWMRDLVVR